MGALHLKKRERRVSFERRLPLPLVARGPPRGNIPATHFVVSCIAGRNAPERRPQPPKGGGERMRAMPVWIGLLVVLGSVTLILAVYMLITRSAGIYVTP